MQPIVLLGVAVAAVALVSTGFLQTETWNEFEVWLQQLGWGEKRLTSPISHAYVDLEIKKIPNPGGDGVLGNGDDWFDNVIQSCSFHGDKSIPQAPSIGPNGETVTVMNPGAIICKILDENLNAFAEGRVSIEQLGGYIASDHELVHINQCITDNGIVETPNGVAANCLDVQAPIHAVKLVVEDSIWILTED